MILYGHAESNAAWPVLLGESPVQVSPRSSEGRPAERHRGRPGMSLHPAAAGQRPASVRRVSGSGLTGLRLTERLPYFTSGVAYPGLRLARAKTCAKDSGAPIAAGYFGADWDVESGEFAWRD